MEIIFFHSFLFTFIVYLHGFIFLNKILRFKKVNNFYEISIIGLIVTIMLAQFINFFVSLNSNLLIFNLITLLIFTIFSYKALIKNLKIDFKILIILGIVSLFNIYGSGFSDDIDHFHYSFIANTDVSNFIWGNSFLHPLYGTEPTWLV